MLRPRAAVRMNMATGRLQQKLVSDRRSAAVCGKGLGKDHRHGNTLLPEMLSTCLLPRTALAYYICRSCVLIPWLPTGKQGTPERIRQTITGQWSNPSWFPANWKKYTDPMVNPGHSKSSPNKRVETTWLEAMWGAMLAPRM